MDDGFDSSDLEFDAPVNPYSWAGAASIEAIIDNAIEDRVTSKKTTKTLTLHEGCPKTEYLTALWYNRFVAFRLHSLKKGVDQVPDGVDIERFLDSIVSKVKPIGNEVPSASWFKCGLRRLIVALFFYYKGFSLAKHDGARLKSLYQQMLKDNRITRQPIRDAQWIGAVLLQRLIISLFKDALDEGTTNWDKTIQKALSLLLIGALSCRTGDIMKDQSDTHHLPFLCYDDITIKLVGGDGIENLEAVVLIRNEKRKKLNPRKNRKVLLRTVSGEGRNIMCPIKLLLASAKRLGAVVGTIEQILLGMASRNDKTLQWANGRGASPVLCGFETAAQHVIINKPAMTDQARATIHTASLKAGFLKPIIPHDIRRGAAQDTAYLEPAKKDGRANVSVAAELGHSARVLESGITDGYVGRRTDDSWTRRLESGYKDAFGAEVTDNVYKKPKWNRDELNRMYLAAGVDRNNRKATREIREKKYKEHEEQWRTTSRNGESGREALTPLMTNGTITTTSKGKRKAGLGDSELLHGEDGIGATDSTIPDPGPDDIESRIDPRLLDSSSAIFAVVANDCASANVDDEIQAIVIGQLGTSVDMPTTLTLPDVGYLDFLSRINIVANKRLASAPSKGIPDTFRGNGRDEPRNFQYNCRKTPGCSYFTDNTTHLQVHEGRCSTDKVEQINTTDLLFPCPEHGCPSSFQSETALKMHRDMQHNYRPRACNMAGCDPTVMYTSRSAYRKHLRDVHPSWEPRKCPVDSCTSEVSFKSAQSLKTHLQTVHKIDDEAHLRRYTYFRTAGYTPQKCSYVGCDHPTVFKEKRVLVTHLEKHHSIAKEDATKYITLDEM